MICCASLLIDRACRSVERKGRGYRVGGSVPGSVESESGIASAGGNVLPCLAGLFAHRDIGAALRYGSVPGTGDGLSVGEAPGKRPVAQSGASAILNGDRRSERAGGLR